MIMKLPRQPGRKEPRYAHLLSGTPQTAEELTPAAEEKAVIQVRGENERIAQLEQDLLSLRQEFNALKDEYDRFRTQFD